MKSICLVVLGVMFVAGAAVAAEAAPKELKYGDGKIYKAMGPSLFSISRLIFPGLYGKSSTSCPIWHGR
jgi:hypothetical protein